MPLEINEIDIAMRVTEDGAWHAGGRDERDVHAAEVNREELIEECVRRVLQAIKAQSEP